MSIWSSSYTLELPPRDQYGREADRVPQQSPTAPAAIDLATGGMSSVIRLSITELELFITPDEARALADALHAAANELADALRQ